MCGKSCAKTCSDWMNYCCCVQVQRAPTAVLGLGPVPQQPPCWWCGGAMASCRSPAPPEAALPAWAGQPPCCPTTLPPAPPRARPGGRRLLPLRRPPMGPPEQRPCAERPALGQPAPAGAALAARPPATALAQATPGAPMPRPVRPAAEHGTLPGARRPRPHPLGQALPGRRRGPARREEAMAGLGTGGPTEVAAAGVARRCESCGLQLMLCCGRWTAWASAVSGRLTPSAAGSATGVPVGGLGKQRGLCGN